MSFERTTQAISLLFIAFAILILFQASRMHGWPLSGTHVAQGTDYASLWTAGKVANEGKPLVAYDWAEQKKEFNLLIGAQVPDNFYLPYPYPPTFLFLMCLAALLSYGLSHLVWTVATSGLCLWAGARISGSIRTALWSSGFVALSYNAFVGQTGALSAALIGLGLYYLPARPLLAGAFFGLLTYKPHLGLLVPIALAAAGYWRAFGAAGVTGMGLAAASALVFGWETWPAFFAQIANMSEHLHNSGDPWKLQSIYSVMRTIGVPASAAIAVHLAVAGLIALTIGWLWSRDEVAYPLKAAALASAALLMSPYLFVYDMSVLLVAQAFLMQKIPADEADIVDILGIFAAGMAILVQPMFPAPLAAAAPVITLALIARRVLATRSAGLAQAAPAAG